MFWQYCFTGGCWKAYQWSFRAIRNWAFGDGRLRCVHCVERTRHQFDASVRQVCRQLLRRCRKRSHVRWEMIEFKFESKKKRKEKKTRKKKDKRKKPNSFRTLFFRLLKKKSKLENYITNDFYFVLFFDCYWKHQRSFNHKVWKTSVILFLCFCTFWFVV